MEGEHRYTSTVVTRKRSKRHRPDSLDTELLFKAAKECNSKRAKKLVETRFNPSGENLVDGKYKLQIVVGKLAWTKYPDTLRSEFATTQAALLCSGAYGGREGLSSWPTIIDRIKTLFETNDIARANMMCLCHMAHHQLQFFTFIRIFSMRCYHSDDIINIIKKHMDYLTDLQRVVSTTLQPHLLQDIITTIVDKYTDYPCFADIRTYSCTRGSHCPFAFYLEHPVHSFVHDHDHTPARERVAFLFP